MSIPDTDITTAWNLVNPHASPALPKSATLAFLHILNYRHEGFRLPRTIPPSLRASFENNTIDYQVDSARNRRLYDDNTSTSRKAKFGDTYLSRIGRTGGSGAPTRGTDFSTVTEDEDLERVRLLRELRELESQHEATLASADKRRQARADGTAARKGGTNWTLVKREAQQLLEWKQKSFVQLENSNGSRGGHGNLESLQRDLDEVKEQVEGLETHLRRRETELEGVRRGITHVR